MKYQIQIPLRLISESNNSDHWTKKHKRKKIQSFLIRNFLKDVVISTPVTIKLIRQGKRLLDEDNLIGGAMKHPKDVIADIIIPGLAPGQADGDNRIKWEYGQQKDKSYALIVEIYN